MFEFEKKTISSNISRFKLVMEETERFDIAGTLYNDFYGFAIDFQGVRQMLGRLDEFFDYVDFPQATHEGRSFREKPPGRKKHPPAGLREVSAEEMKGRRTTFLLHVQFRRNSTWQGALGWVAENKTKRFLSELELIGLIVEALKREADGEGIEKID
ncbi:MAG TPA: hypothetical protein PKA19_14295 [Bacillota bacterium]|nr:hypothetical protein [Bacillota bacterium]